MIDKEKILQKIFSLNQFGIKLGLESTQKLLSIIGNPHLKLKCFHIAGSNGKGSTSSFIASILMEMGFKVGLYTSPHFVRFNERIKINGKEIEDDYLIEFINHIDKYIESERPTFFEITTAMAFKYFSDNKIDYAVIETGLGGRLDATNVIEPISSVITSISLEHTEYLGGTIEKISYEKAGIIKKGKPVFIGNLENEAEKIIIQKSVETNSRLVQLKNYIEEKIDFLKLKCKNFDLNLYETPLKGYHQLLNSALAIKTIDENFPANSFQILNGIKNVIQNTGIQGRYEIFNDKPKVIFDSAHNTEGIQTFLNEFNKEKVKYEKKFLIFSVMKDKNIASMIELLHKNFDDIFYYELKYERAAKYEQIKNILLEKNIKISLLENPNEFLVSFIQQRKNECLVFLGSMYLLGEIKSKIISKET